MVYEGFWKLAHLCSPIFLSLNGFSNPFIWINSYFFPNGSTNGSISENYNNPYVVSVCTVCISFTQRLKLKHRICSCKEIFNTSYSRKAMKHLKMLDYERMWFIQSFENDFHWFSVKKELSTHYHSCFYWIGMDRAGCNSGNWFKFTFVQNPYTSSLVNTDVIFNIAWMKTLLWRTDVQFQWVALFCCQEKYIFAKQMTWYSTLKNLPYSTSCKLNMASTLT